MTHEFQWRVALALWIGLAAIAPAQDDRASQARQAEAEERLRDLARWLGSPDGEPPADLFAADAQATDLAPDGLARRVLHGGIEISRLEDAPAARTARAQAGLHDLAARFAGARSRRVEVAIVGVEAEPARLRTRVQVETTASFADGRLAQQTAGWSVDWTASAPPADPRLQIAAIRLESYEEVSRHAPLFRDATVAVLGPELAGSERLARGGEYWYGRIDGLGEPNFLGHNGIAVGDANGDGREDVYVAMGTGLPNLLLVQQPDGTVRDIAAEAGVAWLDDTKGVLFADTDNDGDRDLLLAMGPEIVLAKNDGHGRFEHFLGMRAPTPGAFYSLSAADYDLDGDLDVYGTRLGEPALGEGGPLPLHDAPSGRTSHLMRNDGEDRFTDVTHEVGLGGTARFSSVGVWGDGGRFVDLNNDGREDLVVPNGNSCLLDTGDGRFADAAFVSGLDFADEVRAVVATDWDGDGDLDLWLRNRSGPQLRFLRNDLTPPGHFVAFQLVGTTASRDAVGARVEVEAGGRKLVRTVAMGDGYLAQSSTRLHFGLGDGARIERVTVPWPGGAVETLAGPPVDRHYRLEQGTGRLEEIPRREARIPDRSPVSPLAGLSRVLLKVPLPLPPSLAAVLGERGSGRATLLDLGSRDCAPCLEHLGALGKSHPALREAGLDVVALRVEGSPEDRESDAAPAPFAVRPLDDGTRVTLDAILRHVLLRHEKLSFPMSLLVDGEGRLQIVYLGPVDPVRLVDDARAWALGKVVPGSARSLYGGRWYFRTERALTSLAGELRELGREDDARFYYLLDQGWRHQLVPAD